MAEPYLNPSQHGFRKHRSCVTQLLHYVHNLATSLDAREQIDNIYLDMEKAFDRVPHEKLLYKLEYLGFRNPLLKQEEQCFQRKYALLVSKGLILSRPSYFCFLVEGRSDNAPSPPRPTITFQV